MEDVTHPVSIKCYPSAEHMQSSRAVPQLGPGADNRLTLDSDIQKSIDPIIQYLSVKYLCNTLEYDSSDLKENGTIPFYRRFFQRQRDGR